MRHPSVPSIHDQLKAAVLELERAEKNAVTLFAEIMRRRLYRDLGHGTILLYAMKELGFSQSKTYQFIRLAEALESLPQLKRAVARGTLPWTKAREVAKVATTRTEGAWIGVAARASRRELERTVAETRAEAKSARRSDRAQAALPGRAPRARDGVESASSLVGPAGVPLPHTIPTSVTLRFTPEQFARFEALVNAVRKRGVKASREALVLAALETDDFAPGCKIEAPAGVAPRARHGRSPYTVSVVLCPSCRRASAPTSRGDAPLDAATTAAILSDCDSVAPDKRRRSAIPPQLRRAVFDRDGHRCTTPGCNSTHFLEIDHIRPVSAGGTNALSNLRLLCSACHRTRHAWEGRSARRRGRGNGAAAPM